MRQLLLSISVIFGITAFAQDANFKTACQQAYAENPQLPRGVLEAVSYTQTRFAYLGPNEQTSCLGLPKSHGYLGMIADGKHYFRENMRKVAQLSAIKVVNIQADPNKEILAYAKAFNAIYQQHKSQGIERALATTFLELSYLPDSGIVNQFAQQSELYELFKFLNKDDFSQLHQFPNYNLNMELIFGENLSILSSSKVVFEPTGIKGTSGATFKPVSSTKSTEYGPAIWNPAPSCNYSSRNGTAISAITIHTIQGTYAGAISWSQNCSSSVSYHYVLRSSDGQVTQMVLEANKAWHVGSENPYTIGYEHEGYVSQNTWYTTAMYNASAGISRDVCQSGYGINPLRTYSGASSTGTNTLGSCIKIKGHQHYPNQTHTDPGIYWNWPLYYQLINNNPTITTVTTSTGSYTDSGGAGANYADDERRLTLIQPANAQNITLNFSSFSTEANWDYLYIYDGATLSAPLIGTYTGTTSPGTITSTGGSLLLEFRSDCATTASGWQATWTSNVVTPAPGDVTPPTTAISTPPTWVTQNFTSNFTDADNAGGSGIEKSYYQVIDYDGTDWRANATKGFFSDNFDQATIHPDWTSQTGTWATSNSYLVQSDEANTNTNLWASVNHSLSNRYLYHWAGKMGGTGTNRRAGMHYFCSDPTLPNRGNSYFVFFRLDNDKVQLYEVANDVFTLVNEVTYDFNLDQWYDFKVIYDRISGKHQVYVDNVKVTSWTDATPLSSGDYISFRSGNSVYTVNDLKVYRSRAASVNITVGSTEMLRYQSANPTTQAGRIKSIVQDTVGNLSSIVSQDVYVDWTAPLDPTFVNDGTAVDISSTTNSNLLEANWSLSSDPHSDVAHNWYSIGTSPGATDVVNWTDNYWNTSVSVGGLSLSIGTTYYVNVKIENGAGLFSAVVSSNGQQVVAPIDPAVASFVSQNTTACAGSTISFSNASTNATSYEWTFTGATPSTSTAVSPDVVFPATGTYTVQLIAVGPGGNDTLTQSISVTISQPVNAVFAVSNDTLILPNTLVTMTNTSQNANGYFWDFGDGSSSTDAQPYHNYASAGTYTVTLTAANDACPQDTATVQIVVLDVTGVGEYSVFEAVFPNPSSDQVIVKTVKNDVALTVRDVNGKVIWVGKTQDGKVTISVKAWSKGVYYLSSDGGEVMEIVVR